MEAIFIIYKLNIFVIIISKYKIPGRTSKDDDLVITLAADDIDTIHESVLISGTSVPALDGKIFKVRKSRKGYGNHVIINHGYGYKTLYAHMSKYIVKKGQEVNRGDIIGYVGNTGTSVAPHLHYEVHKDEKKINPVNFYYNDLTAEQYEKMLEISSQNNQSFD